jgi:hypothetical protein
VRLECRVQGVQRFLGASCGGQPFGFILAQGVISVAPCALHFNVFFEGGKHEEYSQLCCFVRLDGQGTA